MQFAVISLVKTYRLLSPFLEKISVSLGGTLSECKYKRVGDPSCSEYMIEAVQEHGTIRGVGKGIRRILSCHNLKKD